MFKYVIHT